MSKWIGYLPDFYAASPQIAALQGALEQQTEALWTAENGLIDQLDVNKATWGLSCWEASLGLDVDVSRPTPTGGPASSPSCGGRAPPPWP